MTCAITPEAFNTIKKIVSKHLNELIKNKIAFDVKPIIKGIYDILIDSGRDHITALAYAKQVPSAINQLASSITELQDYLIDNSTEFEHIASLARLERNLRSDDWSTFLENFLDLNNSQIVDELTLLNDPNAVVNETGQIESSETPVQQTLDLNVKPIVYSVGERVDVISGKYGTSIIKEDRGDKVLLEDGRQVLKKNLRKNTEVLPIELPIRNGTIYFSDYNPGATFVESWEYTIKDGKIVSGIFMTDFEGEYRDKHTQEDIPENNLEDSYRAISKRYSKNQKIRDRRTWEEKIADATTVEELNDIEHTWAANAWANDKYVDEMREKFAKRRTELTPVKEQTKLSEEEINKAVVVTGADDGFTVIDNSAIKNKTENSGIDYDIRPSVSSHNNYEVTYDTETDKKHAFSENGKSYQFHVLDKKTGKRYYAVGVTNANATTSGRDGMVFVSIEDNGNLPDNIRNILERRLIKEFEKKVKTRPKTFVPLPQSFIDRVNKESGIKPETQFEESATEEKTSQSNNTGFLEGVTDEVKEDEEISEIVIWKYEQFVEFAREKSNKPGEYSYAMLNQVLNALRTGTLTVSEAKELSKLWAKQKSFKNQPNLSPNQQQTLNNAISQIEVRNAKKKAVADKPIEQKMPAPSPQVQHPLKSPNTDNKTSGKDWRATAPTFLADSFFTEALFKKIGDFQNTSRIPKPETSFFFNLKRKIIQMLNKQNIDLDSTQMTYPGVEGGLYLTAMNASKVETTPGDEVNDETVLLVLTDKTGKIIRFNESDFSVVQSGGKMAYFKLHKPQDYFNNNGTLNKDNELVKKHIESLSNSRVVSEKEAEKILTEELELINRIINHVTAAENNTVQLKINGGSVGHIDKSTLTPSRLSAITEGELIAGKDDRVSGIPGLSTGLLYITTDGLYGELISLEKPGIAESGHLEVLADLLIEDLINPEGQRMTYTERKNLVRQYINENGNDITLREIKGEPYDYILLIAGKKQNLSTSAGRAAARKAYLELAEALKDGEQIPVDRIGNYPEFEKRTEETATIDSVVKRGNVYVRKVPRFKMHFAFQYVNKSVNVVTIENLQNGTKRVILTPMPYREFLGKSNTKVNTPDVGSDGTLKKLNAYLTFEPTQKGNDVLYPENTPQKLEQAVQDSLTKGRKAVEDTEQKGDLNIPDKKEIDIDLEEEMRKARETSENDIFEKNRAVKKENKIVTEQQKEQARVWYESTPLFKDAKIPFEALFHLVNSEHPNAIAEWTLAGIKLYAGSDYTDLYHEAWHAFSQVFLTKEQRDAIYEELGKKAGSFKDYKGHLVTFNFANKKQLEEFLAEQFREFMLKKKVIDKAPKTQNLFQRILNALKYLFSNVDYTTFVLNPKSDSIIYELFEKLSTNKLNEFTPDVNNVDFGVLNKGIVAYSQAPGKVNQLSYQDSNMTVEMTDLFFGEFIDVMNDGKTNKYSGKITKDKQTLTLAYRYALKRFKELYNEKVDELKILNEETKTLNAQQESKDNSDKLGKNIVKKNRVLNDIRVLDFIIDEFGDIEDIDNNIPADNKTLTGVIAYHRYKSKIFVDSAVELDFENLSETETFVKSQRAFERSGNESSLKEMAKAEILYLLKTLPDIKNGIPVKNRFGVTKLANFTMTWNKIIRATENLTDVNDLFERLGELAKVYEPVQILLNRLGNPYTVRTNAEHTLWTNLWQTFNKSRIKLIQMTVSEKTDSRGDSYFVAKIGEAFNADFAIGRSWNSDFQAGRGINQEFISRDSSGFFLNTTALLERFPTKESAAANPFEFYRAIGFNLTANPDLIDTLTNLKTRGMYSPTYFWNEIKRLNGDEKNPKIRIDDHALIVSDQLIKRYKELQLLEARYSDMFSNFMVTNAEGNTQFEHSLNNSISVKVNAINAVKSYQELLEKRHLAHLDVRKTIDGKVNPRFNPAAKASLWLRSMFYIDDEFIGTPQWGQRRKTDTGDDIKLRLTNLSGIHLEKDDSSSGNGISSASADPYSKLIMDIHLTYRGFPELMRHADKSTSFSLTLDGPLLDANRSDEQYIPISVFKDADYYVALTKRRLMPQIIAELQRIKILKNLETQGIKNFDFKYLKDGQDFGAFDNVLTKNTKDKLKKYLDNENMEQAIAENDELNSQIMRDIKNYFDKEYTKAEKLFKKANFISKNILEDITLNHKIPSNEAKSKLLRFYVVNNWIHNIESVSLIYGDLTMYNHAKEEFHKRNAGAGSTGTLYRTDGLMQKHINEDLWNGSYAQVHQEELGITERQLYDGTFKTAIVEDMSVGSVYYDEYKKLLDDQANKYEKKQVEADAQGLITFDAYRQLKVAEGTWLPEHEKLFKAIVANKPVNEEDIAKFFPVIKAQYWGPLETETLPIMAFHKYSLMPIIPSVVKNKNLEIVHNRMVKEGISYLTFTSGSKVGTVTNNGKPDLLYADQTKRELAPGIAIKDSDGNFINTPHFTPNVIHLEYLKNQLEIHDEFKRNVIFSTQLRKLIEDGLMENGIPTDFEKNRNYTERKKMWEKLSPTEKKEKSRNYHLLKKYENDLAKLSTYARNKLLKEINGTNNNLTENQKLTNLIALVKKELESQDLGDHAAEFFEVNTDGSLRKDLSLNLNVEKIEKLLNALIVKRLVKQKVNGEALIQVASTLMEDIGVNEKFRNASEEELKKYKGTNDLPFYQRRTEEKSEYQYKGGYSNVGKGSVQGDGKDKAMREIADGFIGEVIKKNSSSYTSAQTIADKDVSNIQPVIEKDFLFAGKKTPTIIMLARNSEFENKPLSEDTKASILAAKEQGAEFIVGDMPKVDSQFIDYLQEINATFTIYHTGTKSRIQPKQSSQNKKSNEPTTSAMKVKVALAGDFVKLLKADDLDGNPIGTIEKLNELIKNEEWLNKDDNRQMITMVAVRIPVQGLNSMEFMEVYEFLPKEAGNIIIPPTEIVTKSGSDFDVDKLTVMMPNIAIVGNRAELYKTTVTTTKTEEELIASRKELLAKVKEINAKYDEIFKKHDIENEFAFSEEESVLFKEVTNDIQKISKSIKDLTDYWSRLSRKEPTLDVVSKMKQIEEKIDEHELELMNLKKQRRVYLQTFNSEKIRQLAEKQNNELKEITEKIQKISRELNSLSDKAIQNDIIMDIKSILELPDNFEGLITPNSTDLLTEKFRGEEAITEELKPFVTEFNFLDNNHDEPRRTKDVKGETKEVISPTRVLEVTYNLYKHMSNNIGKQTLGLGAVDNTYNSLFNRIGAYMNPFFGQSDKNAKPQRQTLLLPHNTIEIDGHDAISLSNIYSKDGIKISDIISQLINGWVDIAKDAWIFNIQGNKEVAPVLLFMIQAGVPFKDAIYFVSNPLIREYVKEQQLAKSTFAGPLGKAPEDPTHFRSAARKIIAKNYIKTPIKTAKELLELANKTLDGISAFDTNKVKERAKKSIDEVNDDDISIFLHYLQIEEMSKTVRDLKMRTNVDTSRDVSLFEASERIESLDDLKKNKRLPAELIRNLETDSPISSFFIQDFQIELLGRLFSLRNSEFITNFINENLKKEQIDRTYGKKEIAVVNWKSDLVNFIFQNELRYFNTKDLTHYKNLKVNDIENPLPIQKVYFKHGAYVKDGVFYVNFRALQKQYKNKDFSNKPNGEVAVNFKNFDYAPVYGDAFEDFNEYAHFVLEREYLRSKISMESLRGSAKLDLRYREAKDKNPQLENESDVEYNTRLYKMAYETYLRDTALTNIFNHWQLFKSMDSYAHEFVRINTDYPELKEHFALMNALAFKTTKGTGYKNLALIDTQIDGDQINVFYENLNGMPNGIADVESLTNPKILRNILPMATDREITDILDFFEKFAVFAFLQSGMNIKSSFALTSFVSQKKILDVLEPAIARFQKMVSTNPEMANNYLSHYNNSFVNVNSNRFLRIRGKNFGNKVSLMSKRGLDFLRKAPEKISPPVFSDTIINLETEPSVFGETYNSSEPINAKQLTKENPNSTYIYAYAIDNQSGAAGRDSGSFHDAGTNVVGLTDRLRYGYSQNQTITDTFVKDLDGKIDPRIKEAIDNNIAQIQLAKDSGQTLVFDAAGYGQNMLKKDSSGKPYAKETFLYLSKELLKFGFVNPGYLATVEGAAEFKMTQPITDEVIRESSDEEVKDFMKRCIS